MTEADLKKIQNDINQNNNFQWIDVRGEQVTTISFCNTGTEEEYVKKHDYLKKSWIHLLVGVKA